MIFAPPPLPAGPGRSELRRMEQFINQAEDLSPQSSTNQQQAPPSSSSPSSSSSQPFGNFGMMRIPGRGRRTDRHVPGVEDETIEASLLGELAVLSISNESHEVRSPYLVLKAGRGTLVALPFDGFYNV